MSTRKHTTHKSPSPKPQIKAIFHCSHSHKWIRLLNLQLCQVQAPWNICRREKLRHSHRLHPLRIVYALLKGLHFTRTLFIGAICWICLHDLATCAHSTLSAQIDFKFDPRWVRPFFQPLDVVQSHFCAHTSLKLEFRCRIKAANWADQRRNEENNEHLRSDVISRARSTLTA